MDCSENGIIQLVHEELRLTECCFHNQKLKDIARAVHESCGKTAEETLVLLHQIYREGFDSGRLSSQEVTVIDDHSVNIINSTVSNAQVGQILTNCKNIIQQQPQGEKRNLLDQLQKDVATIINGLPADKKGQESEIADFLRTIVEQSTGKATPNRPFYSVSAQGLLDASKWVNDFTGNILGTVGQLGKLVWPSFSL